MKIVCAADTHNLQRNIGFPDGDMLILAGDVCLYGNDKELGALNDWIEETNYKDVIVIAGNHDLILEEHPQFALSILKSPKVHYLQDSEITIEGINFYGTPWTKSFGSWADAFTEHDKELDVYWSKIPENTDVLVAHSPPHGILDKTFDGRNEGSFTLFLQVTNRIKPKFHIFGHIHEASGMEQRGITKFINASVINEDYEPVFAPRVITI